MLTLDELKEKIKRIDEINKTLEESYLNRD